MKTETTSIKFDAAKAAALRHYAKKKPVDLDCELRDSLQKLYEKIVPKDVRDYLDATVEPDVERPKRPIRAKDGDAI